jgi:hypothetical protein
VPDISFPFSTYFSLASFPTHLPLDVWRRRRCYGKLVVFRSLVLLTYFQPLWHHLSVKFFYCLSPSSLLLNNLQLSLLYPDFQNGSGHSIVIFVFLGFFALEVDTALRLTVSFYVRRSNFSGTFVCMSVPHAHTSLSANRRLGWSQYGL